MQPHDFYMHRALQLARCGRGRVSPNPMVGAVIVSPDGLIIGEGFHRTYGRAHAEVNAVASVKPKHRHLLTQSTIYVTLEPCSHYGKTPPCSKLIIETGIPNVVVGTTDPFPEVAGRGIRMLRDAGCNVITGVLEKECLALNRRFFTAHTQARPYIQLKWAQSANGLMSLPGNTPVKISSPVGAGLMHRERAVADAVMVGTRTILTDCPRLDCRLWPGRTPKKVTVESAALPACWAPSDNPTKADNLILRHGKAESLPEFMHRLYADHKITSLMVEGGAATLQEFIDAGLYDEIRVETSPESLPGGGTEAPALPLGLTWVNTLKAEGNEIRIFQKP